MVNRWRKIGILGRLFFLSIIILSFILISGDNSFVIGATTMDAYTAYPPFVSTKVAPNVIFALDISGSMKAVAYRDTSVGNWQYGHASAPHSDFDPTVRYFGYFSSEDKYTYDATLEFFKIENTNGKWDGNFMNWLCMRRIDVARKVIVGGKVSVKTLDQDSASTTYNTIAPINRNKAKAWSNWEDNWDEWYILEGQHEPYDYEFMKQYSNSATYATLYPDATNFLISEGELIPQSTSAGNVVTLGDHVEIGQVTMNWDESEPAWHWVPFSNLYNQPRVVAKSCTYNGSQPMGDPRIQFGLADGTRIIWPSQESGATGFWVRLQEWEYLDGSHTTETFSYLVIESATDTGLDKGWIEVTMDGENIWKFQAIQAQIPAGTSYCGYSDPIRVPFDVGASQKPIVFSGVGTYTDSGDTSALVTRNSFGAGTEMTEVYVRIQEQESTGGAGLCTHSSDEYLHVILMIPPNGATTTISTDTYNGASIQAGIKEGVNDAWSTITYSSTNSFSDSPMFIGDMQTADGSNTAGIRVGGSSQTNNESAIQLKIEEETSSDSETDHVDEEVGWLAVGITSSYKIRVGVQTEPEGIVQNISDSMRIGLAVYNYDHTKNSTTIYINNTVNGGTLKPCYPDTSKPSGDRTNYDICLSCGVHDPVENILRAVEEHPLIWGTTPIAETLYEIMLYVKQDNGNYTDGIGYYDDKSTADTFPYGQTNDPYYYPSSSSTVACAKTFVLHFNDGAPYLDWNSGVTHPLSGNLDGVGSSGLNEELDDVAYYLRNTDIRSDLTGHQEIISYYVYAALGEGEQYDSSSRKLREAAVNGGFVDNDNDHIPDPLHPTNINTYVQAGSCTQNEWDDDEDCDPDAFYFANNGYELMDELMAAFQNILLRSASGTAASVISNSRSGEGAIYQSIFFTEYNDVIGNSIKWAGQVHSMLIDAYGNMREDTNGDKKLNLDIDRFIVFDGETVYKYEDSNANGWLDSSESVTPIQTGNLMDINFLWNSSEWLNEISTLDEQRTYSSTDSKRYIFTFIDANANMVAEAGEQIDFSWPSSSPTISDLIDTNKIYPYIQVYPPFQMSAPAYIEIIRASCIPSDPSDPFYDFLQNQTQRIINYIRGEDQAEYTSTTTPSYTIPAFRSRQIDYDDDSTVETWRLGDIVNSTPTLVGMPSEDYDLLYGDSSYTTFVNQYKKRRNVVYVGANDGMFHAFNAGFYDPIDDAFLTQPLDADRNVITSYTAYDLGAELWAYVPYNLIPHLYWLTDPDYTHVYYCDLKPRIFDAKIFTPDTTHPGGWGTVLVAGMRFGGGRIIADMDKTDGPAVDINELTTANDPDDRVMQSAYFIIDITDPEAPPTVLGEVNLNRLGFTTCYPTVIPIKDKIDTTVNGWYLVFGSGPADSSGYPYPIPLDTAASLQTGRIFLLDLVRLAAKEPYFMKSATGTDIIGSLTTLDNNSFISDPIAVDYDLDYKTDAVYFGTVAGNSSAWTGKLRRIVIDNDPDISNWTENNTFISLSQPITAAPSVAVDVSGERWVFFGTGRFFVRSDASDDDQQAYYGLKEPTTGGGWGAISNTNSLVEVTGVKVYEGGSYVDATASPDSALNNVDTYSELYSAIQSQSGWFLNLARTSGEPSERNLGQAALLGDILTFTTYIPSEDICSYEGVSYLYALNYTTGTAYMESVIGTESTDTDANGNEKVNSSISIGKGLSITPNIHTGTEEGSKGFIQTSTGAIEIIEEDNPGIIKSGKTSWEKE
ncbi:MAG: PilC/PilY family type IV pilus protein [bacterium]